MHFAVFSFKPHLLQINSVLALSTAWLSKMEQSSTFILFKVTLYLQRCLQRCLASKRCSASSLNCRYLNPCIKLKLIEVAIKLNQEF